MRAIVVCVDYSDFLELTLPYNAHHFSSVLVVTSMEDDRTREVAAANGTPCFSTDAFYSNGAVFNKWLALEQGLEVMGRRGWLCILDADILWPKQLPKLRLDVGTLYTPRRRVWDKPTKDLLPEHQWKQYPLHRNEAEFAGYSQIFHATDQHLGPAPWHETDWKHAGGADSFFQRKWPARNKVRPAFEVLHMGPTGRNWCGRVTELLDGTRCTGAEERAKQLADFMRQRRQTNSFSGERLR